MKYYFCDEDTIHNSNLNVGTYQDAEKICTKILVPQICQNETQRNLFKRVPNGNYWTGIRRLNNTHFKGYSILTQSDLACFGTEYYPKSYSRNYERHFDFPNETFATLVLNSDEKVEVFWQNERPNDVTLDQNRKCLCYKPVSLLKRF